MAVRSIEVLIGASLTGGFRSSFGRARQEATRLGATVRGLDLQSRQVDGLRRQEAATNDAKAAWEGAEQRLKALTAAAQGSRPATVAEARALKLAENRAKKTQAAYDQLNNSLNNPRPASQAQLRRLAELRDGATRARSEAEALNLALANPRPPSAAQVAELERVRRAAERAQGAADRLGGKIGAARKGGREPTQLQSEGFAAASDRAQMLKARADSLAAAMTGVQAPTTAETNKLQRLQTRAAAAETRFKSFSDSLSKAAPATAAQSARLTRLGNAAAAAATKANTLKSSINAATGPTKAQAAEIDRAQRSANNLKTTYESQVAALQRLDASARASGVNTRSLASEHIRLGRAISDARSQMDRLREAQDRRERRRDVGHSLLMEGAGAAAAGAPIVQSLRVAGDFEHGLARFGTITEEAGDSADRTKARVEALRNTLLGFSRETNQTAPDLLGGLQSLVGKGMESDAAVRTIRAIGRAATATGATVDDLAETTFALTTQMGIKPDQVTRSFNIIGQSAKEGGFELSDMARYFPMLGAQAQAMGITGERGVAQLSAALQVARQGAADPATAANNLRNFMQKITSEETQKNFKDFGIDLESEMKDAMQRGISPVERALSVISSITDNDQFKVSKLFQDMQVNEFIRPMLRGMAEYRRIRDVSFEARAPRTGAGVIDRDFATMMATFKEQTKGASIAIYQLGESVGKALIPVVTPMLGAFTVGVTALGNFANEFPTVTAGALTLGASLVGLRIGFLALRFTGLLLGISRIGTLLPVATAAMGGAAAASLLLGRTLLATGRAGFLAFAAGTRLVTSAVIGLTVGVAALGRALTVGLLAGLRVVGAALLATPFGVAATAVGAVAAAAYAIYNNWEPIRGWWNDLWTGMGSVVSSVGETIRNAWSGVTSYVGSKIDELHAATARFWNSQRWLPGRMVGPTAAPATNTTTPGTTAAPAAPASAAPAPPAVGAAVPSPASPARAPIGPAPVVGSIAPTNSVLEAAAVPPPAQPGSIGTRVGTVMLGPTLPSAVPPPVYNVPGPQTAPGWNERPGINRNVVAPLLRQVDPAYGGTPVAPLRREGRPGEQAPDPTRPMTVDDRYQGPNNASTPTPTSTAVQPPPLPPVATASPNAVGSTMDVRRRQAADNRPIVLPGAIVSAPAAQINAPAPTITPTTPGNTVGTPVVVEGARAAGGPVTGGRPYLVGERGPEIVIPRQTGTVIPNNQIRNFPMPEGVTLGTRTNVPRERPPSPVVEISGERAKGGPVQAGQAYLVGERGREIVVTDNKSVVSHEQAFNTVSTDTAFNTPVELAGARATGGPVQAGRAYLVGERGPEILVPRVGGALTNDPTFSFGTGVPPRLARQLSEDGLRTPGTASVLGRPIESRQGADVRNPPSTAYSGAPNSGTGWRLPSPGGGGAAQPTIDGGIVPGPRGRRAPSERGAARGISPVSTPAPQMGSATGIDAGLGNTVVGPNGLTAAQEAVAPAGSQARAMMDLIGRAEGTDKRVGGVAQTNTGYNTTYAHGKFNPADRGGKNADLTSMTVSEVRDFQRGMLANQRGNSLRSSAAGRYQMMGYTLDDAVKQGVVRPDEKFDAATQDRLAVWKMQQRGLNDLNRGKISKEQYADNLSKEWASLPTANGGGFYAGQRAHVGRGDVMAALDSGSRQAATQTANARPVNPPTIGAAASAANSGNPTGGSGAPTAAAAGQSVATANTAPRDPSQHRKGSGAFQALGASVNTAQDPTSGGETRQSVAPIGGGRDKPGADGADTAPVTLAADNNAAPMGANRGNNIGSISMPISVTVQAGSGKSGETDPNEIARIARLEVQREANRQMASLRQRLHD